MTKIRTLRLLLGSLAVAALFPGISGRCGCENTYQPVCGADKVTYINACVAECQEQLKYTEGACRFVRLFINKAIYWINSLSATEVFFPTTPSALSR